MIHLDITLEDSRLQATYNQDGQDNKGSWNCKFIDNFTGKEQEKTISTESLMSVLALAVHPDGEPVARSVTEHYEFAEPVFADMPKELRMIP